MILPTWTNPVGSKVCAFARSCTKASARRCTIIVTTYVNTAARREVLCGEIMAEVLTFDWTLAGELAAAAD